MAKSTKRAVAQEKANLEAGMSALVASSLHALRDLERRASAAAKEARGCERRGEYRKAAGFYLNLAREQRFIAQQRARAVSLALAGAAHCNLLEGNRANAKVLVRPLRLDDGELIRADQGLHHLLGVTKRRLAAMGARRR
jgi:hypothetical protein